MPASLLIRCAVVTAAALTCFMLPFRHGFDLRKPGVFSRETFARIGVPSVAASFDSGRRRLVHGSIAPPNSPGRRKAGNTNSTSPDAECRPLRPDPVPAHEGLPQRWRD